MSKINSLIFIDFETGGLNCQKNAVTEVAAVAIKGDTLEKIDIVSTFIKPYGDYTYEEAALKHTGISMADLENGITVEEAVQELINLFQKADLYPKTRNTRNILCAHNSAFDKGFLLQLFNYTGNLKWLEKYTYGTKDFYGNWQPEMVDTIPIAKLTWGADEEMSSYNLTNCLVKSGMELTDAHRAINDTLALKDMAIHFAGKLRADVSETGQSSKIRFREHFQL